MRKICKNCSKKFYTKREYGRKICNNCKELKKVKVDKRKGKRAWNYKGEKADYPNQGLFTKNRLIVLRSKNYQCEKCGEPAKQVHHIDGSKDNHAIDNLMAICLRCHFKIHTGRKNKKSKYRDKYGMSFLEIIDVLKKFGMNNFYLLEKKGILKQFLKNYNNSNVDAASKIQLQNNQISDDKK